MWEKNVIPMSNLLIQYPAKTRVRVEVPKIKSKDVIKFFFFWPSNDAFSITSSTENVFMTIHE
jgi:hypothetical protein